MAEYNLEGKLSKSSILKPRKSITEANESSSDYRELRRVSFASSNFVKPFAADAEKNTIWDNTYEEEVLLTDSTRSLDHLETEESVKFNESVFISEANSLEQDMELTNVLSNDPIIVNRNMMQITGEVCTKGFNENGQEIATEKCEQISKKVAVNHSSSKKYISNVTTNYNLDMDITCANQNDDVSDDMEFTCAFPSNIISNIDLKNKQINKTASFQNVTEVPQETKKTTSIVDTFKNDTKTLQYSDQTCRKTFKKLEVSESQKRCKKHHIYEDKMLECSKNQSKILEKSSNTISNLQEQTVANVTSNNYFDTSMEFTCVLPQSQPMNTFADILENDIEFTCSFTNLPNKQKELSSFYIYQSNTSSTEVNDGKIENSEIGDTIIIDKNKYQSIPQMLHTEESSNSSYAILLNSSLYPENPGENIFSVKTSKITSKMNDSKKDETKLKCNGYQMEAKTSFLNISTEPEEEELAQKHSLRNENGIGTTNKENSIILCDTLLDTVSVENPTSAGLLETSIPHLQDSIEEVVEMDNSNSEKNDVHGILRLLKKGREMLNLPKIEIPLYPIDPLLEKLDEIERLHYHLLEKLEPPKIKLIDLEELERLEKDFDASVSGFSVEIVSADSSFSDILAPKSLEELVKEAAPRSKKYWEFVKFEKDCYCFHIAEGMVSFKAKVEPVMGLVDEIRLYNNLPDNERPHIHYIAQYLECKLNIEKLRLPLGDRFDLLALLDYVCICVSDIKNFYDEFEKLVEEYGPIHKFRMDRDLNVIVEVMKIDLVIWWVITLKLSSTSLGYIAQISARSVYEDVDENQVRSIEHKLEGPKYLRHFILLLQEYVEIVGKQVKARREMEFLNI